MAGLHKTLGILVAIFLATTNGFTFSEEEEGSYENVQDLSDDFDFIAFVQTWPFCWNGKHCVPPKEWPRNYWDIQSLRPGMNDGPGGPIYCNTNITFDKDMLEPIMDDLKVYWPEDYSSSSSFGLGSGSPWDRKSIYEKEWTKYGSCIVDNSDVESELDFFTLALRWREKYPIYDILAKKALFPKSKATGNKYANALKTVTGKRPFMNCETFSTYYGLSISQIGFCFNKTSLKALDCPENYGNCPADGMIWYPGTDWLSNHKVSATSDSEDFKWLFGTSVALLTTVVLILLAGLFSAIKSMFFNKKYARLQQ